MLPDSQFCRDIAEPHYLSISANTLSNCRRLPCDMEQSVLIETAVAPKRAPYLNVFPGSIVLLLQRLRLESNLFRHKSIAPNIDLKGIVRKKLEAVRQAPQCINLHNWFAASHV